MFSICNTGEIVILDICAGPIRVAIVGPWRWSYELVIVIFAVILIANL